MILATSSKRGRQGVAVHPPVRRWESFTEKQQGPVPEQGPEQRQRPEQRPRSEPEPEQKPEQKPEPKQVQRLASVDASDAGLQRRPRPSRCQLLR